MKVKTQPTRSVPRCATEPVRGPSEFRFNRRVELIEVRHDRLTRLAGVLVAYERVACDAVQQVVQGPLVGATAPPGLELGEAPLNSTSRVAASWRADTLGEIARATSGG